MSNEIQAVIDGLNIEIIECNNYLHKKNDTGQLSHHSDPMETLSYTRGKSIGLIIARDRLVSMLKTIKATELCKR